MERELDNVGPTTLMLKRLWRKYSNQTLLQDVCDAGYQGSVDFVHTPWDDKKDCNRGFGFINFTSPLAAAAFYKQFNQKFLPKAVRPLEITVADVQGVEANRQHFENCHGEQQPWFAPPAQPDVPIPEASNMVWRL